MRMGVFTFFISPYFAHAIALDSATSIVSETIKSAAESQARIDEKDKRTQKMKTEIERIKQDLENLEVYKKHLSNLLQSQKKEIEKMNNGIQGVHDIKIGIVPLMYRMIDELSIWISKDLPLFTASRQERIELLKAMMLRADVTDSEKFVRILETYQIELDYGSKLSINAEKIMLDGLIREVDVLHFGRISMVAKSLKGDLFWYYDKQQQKWHSLASKDHSSLQNAFDVVYEDSAPSLIMLPLSIGLAKEESAQ